MAALSAFPLVLTAGLQALLHTTVSHAFMGGSDTAAPFIKVWKQLIPFFLSAAIWLCGNRPKRKQEKSLRNKTTADEIDLFSALRDGGGGLSET